MSNCEETSQEKSRLTINSNIRPLTAAYQASTFSNQVCQVGATVCYIHIWDHYTSTYLHHLLPFLRFYLLETMFQENVVDYYLKQWNICLVGNLIFKCTIFCITYFANALQGIMKFVCKRVMVHTRSLLLFSSSCHTTVWYLSLQLLISCLHFLQRAWIGAKTSTYLRYRIFKYAIIFCFTTKPHLHHAPWVNMQFCFCLGKT